MTTIAWDGRCMAADRMMCFGTTPVETRKIFRIKYDGKDALIGYAGTVDEFLPTLEWLKDKKKPKPEGAREEWSAMVVTKAGDVFYAAGKPLFIALGKTKWAIGSGGDYAMGAMDFGANAGEAVQIASARDTSTGLGIDVETF